MRKRRRSSATIMGDDDPRLSQVKQEDVPADLPAVADDSELDRKPFQHLTVKASSDDVRAQSQHNVMVSIDQAWEAARSKDGERGEAATITLDALRKTIDLNPCPHTDRRICWTCAGGENPPWDVEVLQADSEEGYMCQGQPIDGRRAAGLLKIWHKRGVVRLIDNKGNSYSKNDAMTQQVINAFCGSARQQARLTTSARLKGGGLCEEEGMRFKSSLIEEGNCVIWAKSEVQLWHATSCSISTYDWTFSQIIRCTEGSLALALWPASRYNSDILGLTMFQSGVQRPDFHKYVERLHGLHLVHLQAGQMIVIPPMTVRKRIAITKSVTLSNSAIPKALCEPDLVNTIFESVRSLKQRALDDKDIEIFRLDADFELHWWKAIQNRWCEHNAEWAIELAGDMVKRHRGLISRRQ